MTGRRRPQSSDDGAQCQSEIYAGRWCASRLGNYLRPILQAGSASRRMSRWRRIDHCRVAATASRRALEATLEPVFAGRHHVATTIADHRQGAHPEKHVALVGDDRLNRSDTGKTGLAPAAPIPAPCDAARSSPSGVPLPLTRRPTSRPIGRRRARRFPTGASCRAASRLVIAEPIVLDESGNVRSPGRRWPVQS